MNRAKKMHADNASDRRMTTGKANSQRCLPFGLISVVKFIISVVGVNVWFC